MEAKSVNKLKNIPIKIVNLPLDPLIVNHQIIINQRNHLTINKACLVFANIKSTVLILHTSSTKRSLKIYQCNFF